MAREYLEITGIECTRSGNQHIFVVALDGPRGPARIPLSVDALLHYQAAQREILLFTGELYRHLGCEGRTQETADENWRIFVQHALRPPESDPANSTALN